MMKCFNNKNKGDSLGKIKDCFITFHSTYPRRNPYLRNMVLEQLETVYKCDREHLTLSPPWQGSR